MACDFTCATGYVRSGATCVLPCTTGSCSLGSYCNTTSGLCTAGCETSAGCDASSVCNRTTHACVTTIIQQTIGAACPTGYTGGSLCYASSSFPCRYSAESWGLDPGGSAAGSYQGTNTCPAGTTQHGSFTCPGTWFQLFCL
jgi:hypothetical protein